MATDSSFLSLPAELRNTVYELVAGDTDAVSVRDGRLLYAPPLSIACEQIREEYEGSYRQEVTRHATKSNLHLENFVFRKDNVLASADFLPAPAPGVERRYTLQVFLTNTFDSHLQHIRALLSLARREGSDEDDSPGFDGEIRYDPKTFDVAYCRQVLEKLSWCTNILQRTGKLGRELRKVSKQLLRGTRLRNES